MMKGMKIWKSCVAMERVFLRGWILVLLFISASSGLKMVSMSSLLTSGVSEDSNGWTTVWALTLTRISMAVVACIIGAILYFYVIYRCRQRGQEVVSMKEKEQVEEEMLEMGINA